jgi:hypothetical protein
MIKDPELRMSFLENTEGTLLVRIWNENKDILEPVLGHIDGRNLEGRLKKMVHVSELFDGVSGLDGVYMGEGDEGNSAQLSIWCPSCPACFWATHIGCCVTHYWGWSGNSCKGACC